METTNVPPIQFTNLGVVIPSAQAVLAGVIADFQAAFGGNLNLSATDTATLSTPQGQLASSIAAVISNTYEKFLYQSTQTDPAFAQGRWQDAIARIYFLERNPSQPTVVAALCTGLAGTVIPEGSIAVAEDGNLYVCTGGGTIPVGGSITLSFACQVPGPIGCPSGSLNQIYQAIPGWDSITNPEDGVLGNDVESRAAFEDRRAASVAKNSVGPLPAVLGAVLAVANVLDAYVTDNDSDSPVVVGGVLLAAHSLYVAAVGGDAQAIAKAIWSKKIPGCSYNGNTTETVYDTLGYSEPFPSYQVSFETPDPLPILFEVQLSNSAQVPADAATLIQNAIIDAFGGGDGGPRARIGSTIYASRFIAPIAALGPWVQVVSLQIGSNNNAGAVTLAGRINGTTLTVQQVISGTLAAGQTLSDETGAMIVGTKLVSGSGLIWTVDNSQSIPGATFTGSGSGTNLTASSVTGTIGVGMYVSGTGVPAGTKIVSQISGTTGGAGVYQTSHATTSSANALLAAEAMKAAVANQNLVSVNIDQVPVVSAADITVDLV